MSYLAILGRQPALSLAELESVLGAAAVKPLGDHAILQQSPAIASLGGTIKLAQVIHESSSLDPASLDQIANRLSSGHQGKLTLGLSLYGDFKPTDPLRLGMVLKKRLRQQGSVRLVLPKHPGMALTAAQLKFNNLDTTNPELILLAVKNRVLAATTSSYQDIDAYSQRDYGRPDRDAKVGMLPPKLAQILINLSGTSQGLVYDPFCGTGVVLQEARLMGRPVLGSDIDPAMVKAATTNMQWLSRQQADLPSWQVALADATKAGFPAELAAVVSEGYLGPTFSRSPSESELKSADTEISQLTAQFLRHLITAAPADPPVVLCLPVWRLSRGWRWPQIIDQIPRLGYTTKQFVHTRPTDLVYSRPGQVVGRKILVMRRTWPIQKPVDQQN